MTARSDRLTADSSSPNLHRVHSSSTRFYLLIILLAFPSLYASRANHLTTVIRLRSSTPPPLGSSPAGIDDSWARYLDARIAEWKVIFTLACVLVGLSLTMYQIPQALNDPFAFTFASLTQCRAFAALIYAAVLHVYFESEYTHTSRFAIVWWKSTMKSKDDIWNTWVMLSLPVASVLWALLFYLLAIFSFIFRSGVPATDSHPMPLAFTITLQVIITASTLLDLVWFACIWITLNRYRKNYHATQEEA